MALKFGLPNFSSLNTFKVFSFFGDVGVAGVCNHLNQVRLNLDPPFSLKKKGVHVNVLVDDDFL